jgi:hypothetical protein
MDTKALIKKLNEIFCDLNRTEKKYSEVWLTDADFGGLYYSELYVLNIKAEHQIHSCSDEIGYIISLLDEKAKEELKLIWRVDVYNADEEIHCQSDEGLIYNESIACGVDNK